MPEAANREHIKQALEAAHVEITKAIKRVDGAHGADLDELKMAARHLSAFVDFNSGCGKSALTSSQLLSRLH